MTLNGRYTLHSRKDAYFGAHHTTLASTTRRRSGDDLAVVLVKHSCVPSRTTSKNRIWGCGRPGTELTRPGTGEQWREIVETATLLQGHATWWWPQKFEWRETHTISSKNVGHYDSIVSENIIMVLCAYSIRCGSSVQTCFKSWHGITSWVSWLMHRGWVDVDASTVL